MTEPPPEHPTPFPDAPAGQPGTSWPETANPGTSLPPEMFAQLMAAAAAARQGHPYVGMPPGMPSVMLPIGIGGAISQAQIQQSVQLWQGQFPPPEAVERYEKVLPGCFDRMMKMAENLQIAQGSDTERAQDFTHYDIKRGHWLGFAASCLSTIGAVGCVAVGAIYDVTGAFVVATALVGVPAMAVAKALIESARSPAAQPPVLTTTATPLTASTPDNTLP